jgi:hypothetical protein
LALWASNASTFAAQHIEVYGLFHEISGGKAEFVHVPQGDLGINRCVHSSQHEYRDIPELFLPLQDRRGKAEPARLALREHHVQDHEVRPSFLHGLHDAHGA